MGRFEKKFFKSIYRNHGGFMPTWPLGRLVELGDIVTISNKRMDYKGSLTADYDIDFEIREDDTADDLSWSKKSGVDVNIKLKGEASLPNSTIPQGRAGVNLDFKKNFGFLFIPKGIRYNRIQNLVEVRKAALDKLARDHFDGLRRVCIVKEVAVVDSYALTIAFSKESNLDVTANADLDVLKEEDLAKADLGLTVTRKQEIAYNNIGASGGAIFFRAEKIKLRKEVVDQILDERPSLIGAPEDVVASTITGNRIANEGEDLFEFSDMTLDDIEDLTGGDEELDA